MKTHRGRAAVVAALVSSILLAACGSSSPVTSAAQTSPTMQLHREGHWLVDPLNRIVISHGLNAAWKLAPFYPPDSAEGFTGADAQWIAANGFNSVRLATLFQGVMPQKGVIDRAYLDHIDRIVQLLAAHQVYTLLDFHQDYYTQAFGGEGFPAWATDTNGQPAQLGSIPRDVDCRGPFACGFAFDNLWNNTDGLWANYVQAWQAAAAKWRNQDYLMGYDMINEPTGGSTDFTCLNPLGCPLFDTQKLQPFEEYVLKSIRGVDTANLVWLEPNLSFGGGAASWLGTQATVDDANLGLSWHNYCLIGILVGQSPQLPCQQLHALVYTNAEQTAQRLAAAGMETEFGASDELQDIAEVTAQADQQLTGWMYWQYKNWEDPSTQSTNNAESLFSNDADLGTAKTAKLMILERTYPQYTAGVPQQLSFDPTSGAFQYAYQPRPAGGPTVIFVPVALHYPKGYTVQVTGARVTSAANAAYLVLDNEPGASQVAVTVTAVQ